MIGISLFYAFFAFQKLGDTTAPITEEILTPVATLVISTTNSTPIDSIYFYLLDETNISFSVEIKEPPHMNGHKFKRLAWNAYLVGQFFIASYRNHSPYKYYTKEDCILGF